MDGVTIRNNKPFPIFCSVTYTETLGAYEMDAATGGVMKLSQIESKNRHLTDSLWTAKGICIRVEANSSRSLNATNNNYSNRTIWVTVNAFKEPYITSDLSTTDQDYNAKVYNRCKTPFSKYTAKFAISSK